MRLLALSPENFRTLAYGLSDFASDYLERLPQLPSYSSEISGQQTEHSAEIPCRSDGRCGF